MRNGRVLVTGASGLIGRNVVKALLERGVEVHAVSRTLAHQPDGGLVRWHKADLLNRDARIAVLDSSGPRTIIHCAWVTEHGAYWSSPENLDWVAATVSLAREAQERGALRFVGVGTCAEYKWGQDDVLSETSSPLEPATLYGKAKDATRRVIEAFAAGCGLSFAWARVFMLYGAGEAPGRLVASLANALARDEPAKMASGKGVRDLMDARDVGAAIAAIAQSSATGSINIGTGVGTKLGVVGEILARLAARPDLLQLNALPERAEPLCIVADATRLARDVGFQARVRLEDGLRDALAAARERGAA